MANSRSDDSSFGKDRHPDAGAQAQAALLLIESLIHSLIDDGTLSKQQALDAIESAYEVKEESLTEHKEPEPTLRRSLGLLRDMRSSIEAKVGPYGSD